MGTVPFEVAGLKSSLAHDRLPFSLLLRPLVGLLHILLSCSSWSLASRTLTETPSKGAKNPPSNKARYITQSHATCQTFSRALLGAISPCHPSQVFYFDGEVA